VQFPAVKVVIVLVSKVTLNDEPIITVDAPSFFIVRLNRAPPSVAPAGVPWSEKDTSCRDGTEVADPIRPVAADATTPPTARTTPMMMKRSRDCEIAGRKWVIFIEGGFVHRI
jgi:hypothetical protein